MKMVIWCKNLKIVCDQVPAHQYSKGNKTLKDDTKVQFIINLGLFVSMHIYANIKNTTNKEEILNVWDRVKC